MRTMVLAFVAVVLVFAFGVKMAEVSPLLPAAAFVALCVGIVAGSFMGAAFERDSTEAVAAFADAAVRNKDYWRKRCEAAEEQQAYPTEPNESGLRFLPMQADGACSAPDSMAVWHEPARNPEEAMG